MLQDSVSDLRFALHMMRKSVFLVTATIVLCLGFSIGYFFLAPLDAPSPPFVYLPFAQWANFAVVLHVRAAGDPLAPVPSIQRIVAAVDGRLSVMSPATLDSYSSKKSRIATTRRVNAARSFSAISTL